MGFLRFARDAALTCLFTAALALVVYRAGHDPTKALIAAIVGFGAVALGFSALELWLAHRRRIKPAGEASELPPTVCYRPNQAPYDEPVDNVVRHWVGVTSHAAVPVNVMLKLIELEAPPNLGLPKPAVPSAVPTPKGGDAALGLTLQPEREELWFMASTARFDGTNVVGGIGTPAAFLIGPNWKLLTRWRLHLAIVVNGVERGNFRFVIDPAADGALCKLEATP